MRVEIQRVPALDDRRHRRVEQPAAGLDDLVMGELVDPVVGEIDVLAVLVEDAHRTSSSITAASSWV